MTDESQLQIRQKDSESSLSFSKERSGLVARGRADALTLTALAGAEPGEQRHGSFSDVAFIRFPS